MIDPSTSIHDVLRQGHTKHAYTLKNIPMRLINMHAIHSSSPRPSTEATIRYSAHIRVGDLNNPYALTLYVIWKNVYNNNIIIHSNITAHHINPMKYLPQILTHDTPQLPKEFRYNLGKDAIFTYDIPPKDIPNDVQGFINVVRHAWTQTWNQSTYHAYFGPLLHVLRTYINAHPHIFRIEDHDHILYNDGIIEVAETPEIPAKTFSAAIMDTLRAHIPQHIHAPSTQIYRGIDHNANNTEYLPWEKAHILIPDDYITNDTPEGTQHQYIAYQRTINQYTQLLTPLFEELHATYTP